MDWGVDAHKEKQETLRPALLCLPREPPAAHLTALHESLPAQRLRHGPQGGGRDHSGLRQ